MQSRTNRPRNQIPSATAPSGSNKSVNNNEITSATTSMRKPLSDLTNFNLVPTHTLRKLFSSNSISDSETQSLLRKSQVSICQNPPNSAAQKPYTNNPKSDIRSGNSIASSNFDNAAKTNAQNPSPVRRQLPSCSSTKPADEGSKLVIYSQRQGERKSDGLPRSSSHVENKNNRGKSISVPLSSTPAEKAKEKGKAIAVTFDSIADEKAKDKGKAIAVTFDSIAAEKAKDKGKAIAAPFDSTRSKNFRGKEKEISVVSTSSDVGKARDKGKEIDVPSNSTPKQKLRDKGKANAVLSRCSPEAMKNKGRSTDVRISSQQTKKQKEKRQADTLVYSCPPLLRTSNIENDLNQDGDVVLSKSCTGPHRKQKKRKCSEKQSASEGSLSPEYVKQMKAYFEEVDAFELPVEEVSDHDLD